MRIRHEHFALPALAIAAMVTAVTVLELAACLGCGNAGRRVNQAFRVSSETYHATQQAFVAYGLSGAEAKILAPLSPKVMDPGIALLAYDGYLLGLQEVVEQGEEASEFHRLEKVIRTKQSMVAGRFDERNPTLLPMMDQARADLAHAQAALPAAQAKLQILVEADARIISARLAVNALAEVK
jgi:hypothetical protein